MKLPKEFEKRIEQLLGNEAKEYFNSLDMPRTHGLRANLLKCTGEELKKILPADFNIGEEVPWCKSGFYYEDSFPGRHPFYHAGLYYIQEPSAMYPAEAADAKPGEKILDICAAPGGKSVQIASHLRGEGILVSNDISAERVKALVKNLQLSGVTNAVVTNETPEKLSEAFPEYFDKILVDAPCSGEGMFRKDETAVKSWENFKSEKCREMQDDILKYVDKMLKPGGKIIYSTCTFAPLEDEYTIKSFMEHHPDYSLEECPKTGGIADGYFGFNQTARLWPHRLRGEGHFTAILHKEEREKQTEKVKNTKNQSFKLLKEVPREIKEFYLKYCMKDAPDNVYFTMGDNIYSMKEMPPCIDGLKVSLLGTYMGNIAGGKFKPSHQLAMASEKDLFKNNIDLQPGDEALERYLKGETLLYSDVKGYAAVRASGYIVGMGFGQDGVIKNLYPKGWRRTC